MINVNNKRVKDNLLLKVNGKLIEKGVRTAYVYPPNPRSDELKDEDDLHSFVSESTDKKFHIQCVPSSWSNRRKWCFISKTRNLQTERLRNDDSYLGKVLGFGSCSGDPADSKHEVNVIQPGAGMNVMNFQCKDFRNALTEAQRIKESTINFWNDPEIPDPVVLVNDVEIGKFKRALEKRAIENRAKLKYTLRELN